MSIKITIEHNEGNFGRVLNIGRIADAADAGQSLYDAEHTYEVVLSGGRDTERATFTHRYGDPLHTLFVEAVSALESVVGTANRQLFDSPKEARR